MVVYPYGTLQMMKELTVEVGRLRNGLLLLWQHTFKNKDNTNDTSITETDVETTEGFYDYESVPSCVKRNCNIQINL